MLNYVHKSDYQFEYIGYCELLELLHFSNIIIILLCKASVLKQKSFILLEKMSESKDIPKVVAEEQEDYVWVPVSVANRSVPVSFPNSESLTMGATSQCMR